MKKSLFFLFAIFIANIFSAQTELVRWNNSNYSPSFNQSHITVSNLTATVPLSYVQYPSISGFNAFQTNNWPTKNDQAYDPNKYIQLKVSPSQGYKLNLSEFNFSCASQGGDAKIRVDYSINSSFSGPVTVLPETTINSGMSNFSITNFPSPIATDGQTLYIRIYFYNTWNAVHLFLKDGQNFGPLFKGTVESSSTVPTAYNDVANTSINNDIDINVLYNDDYSNKVGTISFTKPAHGIATLNSDNSINYLPNKDYTGADSFSYRITNEYGISNYATVAVNVSAPSQSALIWWDKNTYFGTPFQSFINSTEMTTNGGVIKSIGNESTPIFIFSGISNPTLDTSKYVQFVLDNTSTKKTIEPKSFSYISRGYNPGKYELRYSKNIDFSNSVVAASGTFAASASYSTTTLNITDLKINPQEKLYLRLYLYDCNSSLVMQFLPQGIGPVINGIVYNYVYASNDTIWLDSSNPHWSNGTPTATKNAIIDTNYSTSLYGTFESNNLTINAGASLTVNTGDYIKVNGQIVNNAAASSFSVENNANILQTGNAQNIGNISVKKTAVIPKMGYNYWSSPVIGQNLYQFSEGYNQAATTGTGTPWNRFYVYNEANDYFVTTIANEITLNSTSVLEPARGYAIRGKNSFPETVTVETTPAKFEFVGKPQNGDVATYKLKWTNAAHGYNMVGNPYPSNISFDSFYELNSSKIYGIAYFWTNNDGQVMYQQGSTYSSNNYAIETAVGGTSATYFGFNNRKPNGNISLGQGFIIQAKPAGKNETLTFNNSIRTADTANYYNKTTSQKNRFWLELKSPSNVNNEILIGYIAKATNGFDNDYDADLLSIGSDSFWNVLDSHKLAIQAKDENFTNSDNVTLGFKASVTGNYTISINDKEGIFNSGQTIYLKDKYLNKVFNISDNPYTFYTSAGQYEERFEIVYKSLETLGTDNAVKKGIQIYKDIQNFIVNSPNNLDEVSLYDALGRLIFESKTSKKEVLINKTNLPDGMYIVKARSGNTTMTKKVLK